MSVDISGDYLISDRATPSIQGQLRSTQIACNSTEEKGLSYPYGQVNNQILAGVSSNLWRNSSLWVGLS
jgi:hypothetical protein